MDLRPLLQNRWLLVLAAIGIVCLIAGSLWSGPKAAPTFATANATSTDTSGQSTLGGGGSGPLAQVDAVLAIENAYDKKLATELTNMAGVHGVTVMVTLSGTDAQSLANNVNSTTQKTVRSGETTQSQTQSNTVAMASQNGNTVPIVTQNLSPQVKGVLVTVAADDFYVAKAEIIDAITNVLDVPAYKISVEPQKYNQ